MDAFDLPPICPLPANDLVPMLVIIGVVVGLYGYVETNHHPNNHKHWNQIISRKRTNRR
jgi:hypothetical protein